MKLKSTNVRNTDTLATQEPSTKEAARAMQRAAKAPRSFTRGSAVLRSEVGSDVDTEVDTDADTDVGTDTRRDVSHRAVAPGV